MSLFVNLLLQFLPSQYHRDQSNRLVLKFKSYLIYFCHCLSIYQQAFFIRTAKSTITYLPSALTRTTIMPDLATTIFFWTMATVPPPVTALTSALLHSPSSTPQHDYFFLILQTSLKPWLVPPPLKTFHFSFRIALVTFPNFHLQIFWDLWKKCKHKTKKFHCIIFIQFPQVLKSYIIRVLFSNEGH